MDKDLFRDKIAIVTGASSGIGRATALELARRGAHLALAARRATLLSQVAEEIQALGGQSLVVPTDVTDPAQVHRLVEAVVRRWGGVDILVANAGEYVRATINDQVVDALQRSFRINFYGSVYPILEVLPILKAQGSGHIVVITSVDGKKGLPPDAPYVSAKFALTGFADVLRQELHGSGVAISNVLPGRVDTPMIDHLRVPAISPKITPEAVARGVVSAIRHRKAEVFVPASGSMYYFTSVFSPRFGDWIARRFHLQGWDALQDK